jgi:U3 small nucleolar RNA-associated protein 3
MQLEDMVECKIADMPDQLDNLVKAAALMKAEPVDGDDDDDDDNDDDQSSEDPDLSNEDDVDEPKRKVVGQSVTPTDQESDDDYDEHEIAQSVLNEARFGLRPKEVTAKASINRRRPAPSDFGDEEVDEAKSRKTSQSLASTINTIKQRALVKTRKSDQHDEDLDKQGGDDDRVRRGLAMMEADLGPLDDDDDDDDHDGGDDNSVDDEIDDDLGVDNFYDQIKMKSQVQKAFKKQLHAVAPKYPVMEEVVAGERAITKTILKNRGMSAHKAKINRNPRVEKREQYRKALIRRKGAIREVRTQEGHKYGGEGTGIKTGLSRSRKLGGPA